MDVINEKKPGGLKRIRKKLGIIVLYGVDKIQVKFLRRGVHDLAIGSIYGKIISYSVKQMCFSQTGARVYQEWVEFCFSGRSGHRKCRALCKLVSRTNHKRVKSKIAVKNKRMNGPGLRRHIHRPFIFKQERAFGVFVFGHDKLDGVYFRDMLFCQRINESLIMLFHKIAHNNIWSTDN